MSKKSNPMDEKKKQSKKPKQMEINLPESEAQGTYSNLVMITHSPSEFVLDFIAVMPGISKAKVVKRLVLTPDHAKRLANALNDNVSRYEKENGPIESKDKFDLPFNYRGPKPEA